MGILEVVWRRFSFCVLLLMLVSGETAASGTVETYIVKTGSVSATIATPVISASARTVSSTGIASAVLLSANLTRDIESYADAQRIGHLMRGATTTADYGDFPIGTDGPTIVFLRTNVTLPDAEWEAITYFGSEFEFYHKVGHDTVIVSCYDDCEFIRTQVVNYLTIASIDELLLVHASSGAEQFLRHRGAPSIALDADAASKSLFEIAKWRDQINQALQEAEPKEFTRNARRLPEPLFALLTERRMDIYVAQEAKLGFLLTRLDVAEAEVRAAAETAMRNAAANESLAHLKMAKYAIYATVILGIVSALLATPPALQSWQDYRGRRR